MNVSNRRDPLAGTKPAFIPDPDGPVDPGFREQKLSAILAQARPDVSRRRSPVRPVITVGAAAVLAAAVVVATTTASQPPGANVSSRQVFLAAAEASARVDTPVPGRYWRVRTHSTGINAMWPGPNNDAYLVTLGSGSESWSSRTGADRSVSVHHIDLTTRALTERDQVEWDKAGNPVGIPDAEPAPDAPPPPPMPTSVPPTAIWQAGEPSFSIGEKNRPLSEVLALPTDPAPLKAELLANAPADAGDEWLAWEALKLVEGSVPTTPELRAAAYRLLADLPGFRVMADAELPAGTVGVAHTMRSSWNYTVEDALVEQQVIIDRDTGSMREGRMVLIKPGKEARKLPAGTVLDAETVEQVGWVDTAPVLPPGTEQYGLGGGR